MTNNHIQLIKDAKAMHEIRKIYVNSPSKKLDFMLIKNEFGASQNLEIYLKNLQKTQESLEKFNETYGSAFFRADLKEKFEIKASFFEKTPFGCIARCEEKDIRDEEYDLKFSEFVKYKPCVILPNDDRKGALYFEYQECGRPAGCAAARI